MPILEPLKFENRTWDAIEEHGSSENKFKIRRKPVISDRVYLSIEYKSLTETGQTFL